MIKPLLSLLCLFLFLLGQNISAQTSLSVGNLVASASEEVIISVNIDNDEVFNAFQFDLCFPDQLSWKQGDGTLTDRAKGHTLTVELVEPGRLRVVSYSMTLAEFSGITGEVFQVGFVLGNEPGNWELTLENATIGGVSGNILDQANKGILTLLAPKLVITPNVLDFGDVPLGESRTENLVLQNTGNEELEVSGISFEDTHFSCSGTQSFKIPADGSHNLGVVFSSQNKGQIESSVTIQSNQPGGDELASVKALAFAVNEIHLLEASGYSGQEVEVPITLNNMESFTGFQLSIPLPDVATFVEGSEKLNVERKTDHIVAVDTANGSLNIVAYSPSNTPFVGSDGQIMTIRLNLQGQGGNYSLNPQNAIISDAEGKNIISATYGADLRVKAAHISVETNSLDYGTVSTMETQSRNLLIHNYGDDELMIEDFVFGDNHFSADCTFPIWIPSYGNETITIYFSDDDALLHESFLRIHSNDAKRNPTEIQLTAQSYFPNELKVVNLWSLASSKDTLYINLSNQQDVSGFQLDAEFSEGVSPALSEIFLSDRKSDHSLATSELSQGKIRLLCWSASLSTFSGTDGVILGIPVEIAANVTGIQNIQLSNVVISNEKGESIESGFSNGTLTIGIDLSGVDFHIAEGKLLNTTTAMEYSMGDDNWISCSEEITPDVLFDEGELKIREITNPENTWLLTSLVRPMGSIVKIDYQNESSLENIPENISYSSSSDMSEDLSWGSNQPIALTPGKDLYFRTDATASSLASGIATLTVPLRPEAPNHTIDYENEQTFEIVTIEEEYSFNNFSDNTLEGSGEIIKLNPGNDVWFRYPATHSNFCSDKFKLEVKLRPAKPVFTVDYAGMETSEIVPNTIEYANDSAFTENYGTGTGQAISLTMENSYWFRSKASNEHEQFCSESYQLVVSSTPAAPEYSIDYLNEQTAQEIPENVEYSEDAGFTQNVQKGTGAKLALEPAQDLWFRVAETNSNDAGNVFHLIVPERPLAPTIAEENDETNLFDWNWVDGFEQIEDYEFSLDGGENWDTVSEKPLQIGDIALPAGKVQVRLGAQFNNEFSCFAGDPLISTINYSVVVGIEDLQTDISVYPNPVHDHLTIKVPGNRKLKVFLTNQGGKVLLIRHFYGEYITLDISNLPSGMYFLIMERDASRITKKILKI